jgi:hypothetical protein
VPLSLGSANRLAFSATDARRPFLTENAAMWAFFEAGLSEKLSDLDRDAKLCGQPQPAPTGEGIRR